MRITKALLMHLLLNSIVLLTLSLEQSFADDFERQAKANRLIIELSDAICSIPLEGSQSSLELSGEAKAKLNNFLKKIADLGIEGAAKYRSEKWEGVLQKDLASLIQMRTNCKLEIYRDLQKKLMSPVSKLPHPKEKFCLLIDDPVYIEDRNVLLMIGDDPNAAVTSLVSDSLIVKTTEKRYVYNNIKVGDRYSFKYLGKKFYVDVLFIEYDLEYCIAVFKEKA